MDLPVVSQEEALIPGTCRPVVEPRCGGDVDLVDIAESSPVSPLIDRACPTSQEKVGERLNPHDPDLLAPESIDIDLKPLGFGSGSKVMPPPSERQDITKGKGVRDLTRIIALSAKGVRTGNDYRRHRRIHVLIGTEHPHVGV